MKKIILRRLIQLLPVLLGITFLSFAMMHLAGSDAVTELYGNTGAAVSSEVLESARARHGLNDSFPVQYFRWLFRMLTGDMGVSYVSGRDVLTTFMSKLPATLLLALVSIIMTVVVSLPLGILAAVRHHKAVDLIIRFLSFTGNSLPGFFTALLLMRLFSVRLGWFPVISTGVNMKSVFLPALTLGISMSSKYTRQIRAVVLEELGKEYVTGALARGIPYHTILFRNVLRVSMLTIATLLALSIGSLLGGTAIIETIFMWDGVGKMAVDAITMRDYPVIQAYVVWMAVIYVTVNLVSDLINHALDPRIRLEVDRR